MTDMGWGQPEPHSPNSAASGQPLTMRMKRARSALSGRPWICNRKMSWWSQYVLLSTPLGGGGNGFQHWGRGWAPHRKPQLYLGHMLGSPVAHQHLKEELGGKDAVGNGVMAGGVLQTQPPGDTSSGNMLQILPSTCQPLIPPSSPPTLGEHQRDVILPLPLIPSFIHSSSKADSMSTM